MPRVLQVIEAEDRVGSGRDEDDPVRVIRRYYTLDGDLLASSPDPWERDTLPEARAEAAELRRQVGDMAYAVGELESIRAALSDVDGVTAYAKVEALLGRKLRKARGGKAR